MRTEAFEYNGYQATVIIPDNPNGKWVWKTEFLYAFDQAERMLVDMGYTRVYYAISNMYGSPGAVKLMHDFFGYVREKYSLSEKCVLFGFSRGGLYAFNFALSHPECTEKIYLDAPVLDLNSWPPEGSNERLQVYAEFSLNRETLATFNGNPVNNFAKFLSHGIPLMIVAGGADEIVPFAENSKLLLDYADENGIKVERVIKPDCKHHPHSIVDVTPIIKFITNN